MRWMRVSVATLLVMLLAGAAGAEDRLFVDAGSDEVLVWPDNSIRLWGYVSKAGEQPPTIAWTQLSGPETARIDEPSVERISIEFPAPGLYVLRLQASDGLARGSDDVTIDVRRGVDQAAAAAEPGAELGFEPPEPLPTPSYDAAQDLRTRRAIATPVEYPTVTTVPSPTPVTTRVSKVVFDEPEEDTWPADAPSDVDVAEDRLIAEDHPVDDALADDPSIDAEPYTPSRFDFVSEEVDVVTESAVVDSVAAADVVATESIAQRERTMRQALEATTQSVDLIGEAMFQGPADVPASEPAQPAVTVVRQQPPVAAAPILAKAPTPPSVPARAVPSIPIKPRTAPSVATAPAAPSILAEEPAPASEPPPAVPAPGPTVLRIAVTDSTGKPAANVSLFVKGPSGVQRASTDSKGVAEFRTDDFSMPRDWIEETVDVTAQSSACQAAKASAEAHIAANHQAAANLRLPPCP